MLQRIVRIMAPSLTLAVICVSVVSFKVSRWHFSAFDLTPQLGFIEYVLTFVFVFVPSCMIACGEAGFLAIKRMDLYARAHGLRGFLESGGAEGEPRGSAIHWYAIGILVVHGFSAGAAYVSVSLLHVSVPRTFWLVVAGALLTSLAIAAVVGFYVLAGLGMTLGMEAFKGLHLREDRERHVEKYLFVKRLEELRLIDSRQQNGLNEYETRVQEIRRYAKGEGDPVRRTGSFPAWAREDFVDVLRWLGESIDEANDTQE